MHFGQSGCSSVVSKSTAGANGPLRRSPIILLLTPCPALSQSHISPVTVPPTQRPFRPRQVLHTLSCRVTTLYPALSSSHIIAITSRPGHGRSIARHHCSNTMHSCSSLLEHYAFMLLPSVLHGGRSRCACASATPTEAMHTTARATHFAVGATIASDLGLAPLTCIRSLREPILLQYRRRDLRLTHRRWQPKFG